MPAARKRKANTTARKLMVFNPAGGRTLNGSRRRRKVTHRRRRRSNPTTALSARTARPVARRRNPRRASFKRNPAGIGGLLWASLMAGVGVTIFDMGLSKLFPTQSATLRIGLKAGGAYLFQTMGQKIPVIGRYNKEIALVLGVAAAIDVLNQYAVPVVNNAISSVTGALLPAPAATTTVASDGTTSGIRRPLPPYYPQGRRIVPMARYA